MCFAYPPSSHISCPFRRCNRRDRPPFVRSLRSPTLPLSPSLPVRAHFHRSFAGSREVSCKIRVSFRPRPLPTAPLSSLPLRALFRLLRIMLAVYMLFALHTPLPPRNTPLLSLRPSRTL